MLFTREKLTSEFCDMSQFLGEHTEVIKELYQKALALNLDEPENGMESHIILCTIVAVCLISNNDNPAFPLSYEEGDEELLAVVAEGVDTVMTVENFVNCGVLKKEIINGEARYTSEEPPKKAKKTRGKK